MGIRSQIPNLVVPMERLFGSSFANSSVSTPSANTTYTLLNVAGPGSRGVVRYIFANTQVSFKQLTITVDGNSVSIPTSGNYTYPLLIYPGNTTMQNYQGGPLMMELYIEFNSSCVITITTGATGGGQATALYSLHADFSRYENWKLQDWDELKSQSFSQMISSRLLRSYSRSDVTLAAGTYDIINITGRGATTTTLINGQGNGGTQQVLQVIATVDGSLAGGVGAAVLGTSAPSPLSLSPLLFNVSLRLQVVVSQSTQNFSVGGFYTLLN